ncbi:type III toxin-antitoxin system TenpIN family toxin [Pectobacterium sp. CHL-2024]|uniref:type III toxin-antitoxin system TenpIN family toxin n=1 Tax=Pectobacterium sp. CHL-2024 TaxID=3377079 RepID=UPI0038117104
MELRKLDNTFYQHNPVVHEALDFDARSNSWLGGDKIRGHGIVQIQLNGLTFAIPVRSHIRHDDCHIIERDTSRNDVRGMGLDYSKAMLITDPSYVSTEVFLLKSKKAAKDLLSKELHITKQFSKYVARYVEAVRKNDTNILRRDYRFTTLINYHTELGLTVPSTE